MELQRQTKVYPAALKEKGVSDPGCAGGNSLEVFNPTANTLETSVPHPLYSALATLLLNSLTLKILFFL